VTAPPALPPWLAPALRQGLDMPAHALLLHAPGAVGQFELALALARAWLCEHAAPGEPACGQCTACRLMDAHSHADFQLLVPEALRPALGWTQGDEGEGAEEGDGKTKAKPSREIKIKALRAAIDWSQKTAARGRAKVLVIHPAEAMNATTANALLKTLEEPPGALRLLLTANDPEALLPTVRSRCQRLAIALPPPEQALAWLDAQGVSGAQVLLAAAGGQPHGARDLHADGIDAQAWSALPCAVRRGHAGPLLQWPLPRVIGALHRLCHDLLALRAGGKPRYFATEALAPALRPQLPSLAALTGWQRELARAVRHEDHPWHAGLRIESLVAQAAALWHTARAPTAGRTSPLDTLPGR
jgi:DNA polymerase-3 subunit delta'